MAISKAGTPHPLIPEAASCWRLLIRAALSAVVLSFALCPGLVPQTSEGNFLVASSQTVVPRMSPPQSVQFIPRLLPIHPSSPLHPTSPSSALLHPSSYLSSAGSRTKFNRNAHSSENKETLDLTGLVVTARAQNIEPDLPDPMLACSDEASNVYAFALTNFRAARPFLLGDGNTNDLFVLFRDYGCFTHYKAPAPVFFGAQAFEPAVAVLSTTGQIVDVGSAHFTRRFHSGEFSAKSRFDKEQIFETAAWLRAQKPAGSARNHNTVGVVVVSEPAVGISSWYAGDSLMGQPFQEMMTFVARIYTSGLLDQPLTIVLQAVEGKFDPHLRSWIFKFLIAETNVTILELQVGQAALLLDPRFVTPSGPEAIEPCNDEFVARFLFPRVVEDVRHDVSFKYGDDSLRKVQAQSWLSTLPKSVAILKNNSHARHRRAYELDTDDEVELARTFAVIPDDAPFTHRIALLNSARVVLTTFGSLFSMMGRLTSWRIAQKSFIVIGHPGYARERRWAAPRPCRYAVDQDGFEELLTSVSSVSPPKAEVKYVWPPDGVTWKQIAARPQTFNLTLTNGAVRRSDPKARARMVESLRDDWKRLPGYQCAPNYDWR